MTMRHNILVCMVCNVIDRAVTIMHFLIEILFSLNVIKSHFKGSYDKQNLTLVVISSF